MSSTGDDYATTGEADVTAYISTIFTMTFLACVYLVWKFAETGFPKVTYVTCIYGYFCTFALLLVVPIDLAAVIIDRRNDNETNYSQNFQDLVGSYNSVFIPILILSNVVLVFEEYYNTDGYFTIPMRLYSAFKRMMIDIFAMLVAGIVILAILIGTHVTSGDAGALQLSAVIVTNTVYETMLMFLLAYGLAQFPQMLWYSADLNYSLLQAQMRASTSFKRLGDASLDVSLVVSDVMKTKKHLEAQNDTKLADAMKVLLMDVPDGFTSSTMGKVAVDKKGQVTVDTLADLRTRLCVKKDTYRMALGGVEGVKFRAYNLEDVVAAASRTDGKESIYWSLYAKESSRTEWLWHLKILPWCRRIGAVLALAIAIFMLLGVMGSINGAKGVSIYYHIVHSDSANAGGIVIFVLFTLGYTAYITLWSLLQVKVAGLMELVEGQTTPQSMSFNVRMCMRLTPPLAFFYLGWLSENGVNSTGDFLKSANGLYDMPLGFTKIYEIGKVAVLRKCFGTVFPVLLFCLVFVFLFNLWNRLAVYLKLGDFQFGTELVADDVLREGKRQLGRYKKHMERKCQRKEFKGKLDTAGATLAGEKPPLMQRIVAYFTAKPQTMKVNDDGDEETGDGDGVNIRSNPALKLKVPLPLSGNVERKGDKKMMGSGGWRVSFAAVVAPGRLKFFKDAVSLVGNEVDPKTMKNNSEVFPEVDLTLVLSCAAVVKKKKTEAYLDLELGDETVSLRFKTVEEMELWKSGLNKWKEYSVAHGE